MPRFSSALLIGTTAEVFTCSGLSDHQVLSSGLLALSYSCLLHCTGCSYHISQGLCLMHATGVLQCFAFSISLLLTACLPALLRLVLLVFPLAVFERCLEPLSDATLTVQSCGSVHTTIDQVKKLQIYI